MNNNQSDKPVHVTGEERLHPALRKLGRACIALARWQRDQQATAAERTSTPSAGGSETPPVPRAETDGQEARDADL